MLFFHNNMELSVLNIHDDEDHTSAYVPMIIPISLMAPTGHSILSYKN